MPFFLYKDAIAGKGVLLKFCVRNFDRYLLLIYFIIVNLVTRNKGDTVCTNIEPTHCLEVTLLVVALLSTLGVAALLSIVIVAEQLYV